MAEKVGAEVKPNGQGGHTTVNKDAAGGGAPAVAVPEQQPVLKMAAGVKADVLKRLDEVLKGAGELKAQVEKSADDATVTTVPETLAKSLGELLVNPVVDVAKGYKQVTPKRLTEMKEAVGKLTSLLGQLEVLQPASAEAKSTNAESLGVTAAVQAAPSVDVAAEVSKSVNSALAPVTQTFQTVGQSLDVIQKSLGKLADRVSGMERGGRVSSNATPTDSTPARVETKKSKKSMWPTDLAAKRPGTKKK